MEDVQFALSVFLRSEDQETSVSHMRQYLLSRYVLPVMVREEVAVRGALNFLVRNWGELVEVGLVIPKESAVVDALLFAIHNRVFRSLDMEEWKKVPDADFREVVREAQAFIDAGGASQN